jgi:alpha-amylase
MKISGNVALAACFNMAIAATTGDWRSRSIYQVVTDRFARADGSTTASCNTEDRQYCGGTYQGIINHLDYIQGMGFTAVSKCTVKRTLNVYSI